MDTPPLRPVGNLEKFLIHQHFVGFYNNVQVAAIYTIQNTNVGIASNQIQGIVHAVIGQILNQHPILGICLGNEDSSQPTWTRIEQIDLRQIVHFIESDSNLTNLDAAIQNEHQKPFHRSQELPLWRCLVVHPPRASMDETAIRFALSFSFHHVVGDGLSGAAFHRTFLSALNELLSSTEAIQNNFNFSGKEEVQVPKLALIPHLEESMPLPLTPFFVLRKAINAFLFSGTDVAQWSGPPIKEQRPPISRTRTFQLPQKFVSSLRSNCRNYGTTITALATIIVARSLAALHPTHTRFVGAVPFSLRKFSKHSANDMGCYTAIAEPCFSSEGSPPWGYIPCRSTGFPGAASSSTDDESIWQGAKACKDFIHERSASPLNLSVGLTKFIGDYRPHFLKMLGGNRRHAFTVTNIGVVDGGISPATPPKKQRAVFERVVFSVGASTNGSPYSICLASAVEGDMSVTLNWEEGVVEEEKANGLLVLLEKELTRFAKQKVEAG